jgi:tRNA modification GTPase
VKRRTPRGPDVLVAGDTIVAIATPVGHGAVGLVRLSGPAALSIAAPAVGGPLALGQFPSHVARAVHLVDPAGGALLDRALVTVMRAPRSYTGEDVVELSCHGSPALLGTIVRVLRDAGARVAEPGEFTRRAFLNGRLNLAQAEAVALLIGARTERAVALAAKALEGELAARVSGLRQRLLDVVAGLEVQLDFPDERVGLDPAAAASATKELAAEVGRCLGQIGRGRAAHEGVTVAIVGAPNAGKSTLLNALVGRERAIVSPTPGTTRDVLDATVTLSGVPVTFQDTAGIGQTDDPIEAEGVRRALKAIDEADLVLVVLDGSRPADPQILEWTVAARRIVVRSKCDLPRHAEAGIPAVAVDVCALSGLGVDPLREVIVAEVEALAGAEGDEAAMVATLRQTEILGSLHETLGVAAAALGSQPLEVALVELREALGLAGDILGLEVGDAVLDRIFASFCLGK